MVSTIFLFCLILSLIFFTIYVKLYFNILQYHIWSNKIKSENSDTIIQSVFMFMMIFYIICFFVFLVYIVCGHTLYYYLVRLFYWKCYIPILCYLLVLTLILLAFLFSKQYKLSKQAHYISNKMEMILNSIKSFESEISDIDDDRHLSHNDRTTLINELKETINMLKQIYAELYRSFDILLVNESIDNIKDVEVSESNITNLERKIQEFEAYRSLSDVSVELDNLVKKYTK